MTKIFLVSALIIVLFKISLDISFESDKNYDMYYNVLSILIFYIYIFLTEMPIPIVIILVEGDLHSIQHVMEATSMGIPVIIIKGSGKAADVIIDYLERSAI